MDDDDDFIADLLYTISNIVISFTIVLVAFAVFATCCSGGGIELSDDGVPGAFDDQAQFEEEEAEALELMDERSRQSYLTAKRWVEQNPPNSADSDLSLSQYMAIQDKAVGAYEFTIDIHHQRVATVLNKTEIEFHRLRRGADDGDAEPAAAAAAAAVGVCATVQSNLPLLKEKSCYYWEVKIYALEPGTRLAVGLATKPYPLFRLPGFHRFSVAYDSTGAKRLNMPFRADQYGRPWQRGDVIGVGYRPVSGAVFFTHNGRKLDDAGLGFRCNVFPSVGATGPCSVYVNFGQDGFVYIPANVNNWKLAPAQGSLPPPPAYGRQEDSVLLEYTAPLTAGPSAPPYDDLRTPPGSPDSVPRGESATDQGTTHADADAAAAADVAAADVAAHPHTDNNAHTAESSAKSSKSANASAANATKPSASSAAKSDTAIDADTAEAGTAKADTAKADTAKADTAKADTTKADTTKSGTTKSGTAQADTAKADTAKADTAKGNTTNADTEAGTAKADTAKGNTTKADTEAGTAKADTAKGNTTKADTAQADTTKADSATTGTASAGTSVVTADTDTTNEPSDRQSAPTNTHRAPKPAKRKRKKPKSRKK